MNQAQNFQQRIDFTGNLQPLLEQVCFSYQLGAYIFHELILTGYEDVNVQLVTNKGTFFVKIFHKMRTDEACQRYVSIMERAIADGISHPKLFKSDAGFLFKHAMASTHFRLVVMEHINGQSFYESTIVPTDAEVAMIVSQAAKINNLALTPTPIFDDWAIVNFLGIFEKRRLYLAKDDLEIMQAIAEQVKVFNISQLPQCFVHGDLIKTNILKAESGQLYLIDFSVSNVYPRIMELAVLLCNVFFDENQPDTFPKRYELVVSEYEKYIQLTPQEKQYLPLYIKIAHAIHILNPTYEKVVNRNASVENEYWLKCGRTGLAYTHKLWP